MSVKTRPMPAFEHMPSIRVIKNTVQTITVNTGTPVIWNTVEHETPAANSTPSMWTATYPTRFFAPTPGVYYCTANANFGPGFGGFRIFYLVLNGGQIVAVSVLSFGASGFYHAECVSCDVNMASGDYIEMLVYHSYNPSLNLDNISMMSMSLRLVYPTTHRDFA